MTTHSDPQIPRRDTKEGNQAMARIHRAIVSVSDKTGVAQFCAALSRLGVELYASVAAPCRMRRIDPLGATPYL